MYHIKQNSSINLTSGNTNDKVRTMNWKKITQELLDSGLTEEELAQKVGSSQSAINRLKKEQTKEPYYEMGFKMIVLHKKIKDK